MKMAQHQRPNLEARHYTSYHRLGSISAAADQLGVTPRTSYSTIIREVHDYSCVLFAEVDIVLEHRWTERQRPLVITGLA